MKLIGGGSLALFPIKHSEHTNSWNKTTEASAAANIHELRGAYEEVHLVVIWTNAETTVETSGENGAESKYLV